MKYILIIFILFTLPTKSQDFCLLYTGSKPDTAYIKKQIIDEIKEAKKKEKVDSSFFKYVGDTLMVNLYDNTNGIRYKFAFGYRDSSKIDKVCTYQEVSYDCNPCSQTYLETYRKFYKFRKIDDNTFLSTPLWQTEMKVIYNGESKSCLTLKFKYVDLPEKEFKQAYNKLKK